MTGLIDPEGNETRVLHELVNFTGQDVLEIGCGDGRLMSRYADHAATVLGIDPVEADIQIARSATPKHLRSKVSFRVADAVTVDIASDSFDVVVFGRSI